MRDIFIVAKFTAKDMVKRKSFIVSTLLILAMIVIGFNIPNIIKGFSSGELSKAIIVDKENVFEGKIPSKDDSYEYMLEDLSLDDIKEKINNGEAEYGVIINRDNNIINLTYVLENKMSSGPSDEFTETLASIYKEIELNKLNLTPEQKEKLNPQFNYLLEVSSDDIKGNIFVMMLISIVLFYAVYFCAFQVSNAITIEKTSKIIETLATSTSPTNIIVGKTVGAGLVGLGQLILIIITAYISATVFIERSVLASVIDVSSLSLSLGFITLLYFILGYLIYAFLYALTGSTVSKPEDIQSANQPVVFITLAGFYLAYFSMMNPSSSVNQLAAILPISSPFCMPLRVMMGVASNAELITSVLVLVISIVVVAKVAIKIYSSAILNYGKSSLKDMLKMYKQK